MKTIKMTKDRGDNPGNMPTEADVHPDEVKNWQGAGWQIAKEPEPEPDAGKKPEKKTKKTSA